MLKDPQPGTKEAVDAGCSCPEIDNTLGPERFVLNPEVIDGSILYLLTVNCSLHGTNEFGCLNPVGPDSWF